MQVTAPKTFEELVKNVETALKDSTSFRVVFHNGEDESARLKSLKIQEVQLNKNRRTNEVASAVVLVEGLFKGKSGPHEFEAPKSFLAALGLDELAIGTGAFSYANGTVRKGLSLRVSGKLLKGSLAEEAELLSGVKKEKIQNAAIVKACRSKPYIATLEELDAVEAQLRKLTAKAHKLRVKVEQLEVKAMDKAVAKAKSACIAPKPKYEVLVTG